MTPEQKAAYIMAQAACANAEILGMQAENMQREAEGKSMAYTCEDFQNVIIQNGIYHNAVVTFMKD